MQRMQNFGPAITRKFPIRGVSPGCDLVQRRQSQIPGDIYDSLSGDRNPYPNPDRDFFGPNAGGKIY